MNERQKGISDYDEKNEVVNDNILPLKEIISKIFPIDNNDIFSSVLRCCRMTFYNIKYNNKKINNLQNRTLSYLVFGILYYYSNNKKELYVLFKKYISYLGMFENFLKLVMCKEQRKCVYEYIKNKKSVEDVDIHKKYNNFIKCIKNKPCEKINMETINKLKTSIEELKTTINITCKSTIEMFTNDSKIEDTTILINIITTYLEKIEKIYKYTKKFNKPELEVYNHIIKQKTVYPHIIQVFNDVTIPISRNKNFQKLSADILIIFDIDSIIKFGIIEYDGPTHYNINDFRFNDNIIFRDKCKNQFCIDNNISLLRLHYKNTICVCMDNINLFINQVINSIETVYFGIPTDEFYDNLLLSYYNKKSFDKK
jgi:hypothetical protein